MTLWSCCGRAIWRWRLTLWTGIKSAVGFSLNVLQSLYMNRTLHFFTKLITHLFASRDCSLTPPTFVLNVIYTKIHVSTCFGHVTASRLCGLFFFFNFSDTDTKSLLINLLFLAKMYLAAVVNSPGPYSRHVDITDFCSYSSREADSWP